MNSKEAASGSTGPGITGKSGASGSASGSAPLFNRKQRREYQRRTGQLKNKSNLSFSDWLTMIKNNIKEGKKRHIENEDMWRNEMYEQLSQKESDIIKHLTERNFTKEEIDAYLEKWYKTL